MPIHAYVGLPRSGKSYTAVEHTVLPALRAGRRVVTNLAMRWDLVRRDFPQGELIELALDKIVARPEALFEEVRPGCVLVIDEVWKLFPAGVKVNQVPEPFKRLLAEHGHMVDGEGRTVQVVLVTQDLAQVGAFARQLVEQTFMTTKLSAFGLRKRYRVDVFNRAVTGTPPATKRVREIYGHYRSEVYKYYVSHTMSESASAGADERPVDGRGNIWKSPVWYVGGAIVLLLGTWGIRSAWGALHKEPEKPPVAASEPRVSAATARPAPASVAPVALAPAPAPMPKASWRVVGYVEMPTRPEGSIAMLSNGERVFTVPLRQCRRVDGLWQCLFEGVYWSETGVGIRAGFDDGV